MRKNRMFYLTEKEGSSDNKKSNYPSCFTYEANLEMYEQDFINYHDGKHKKLLHKHYPLSLMLLYLVSDTSATQYNYVIGTIVQV